MVSGTRAETLATPADTGPDLVQHHASRLWPTDCTVVIGTSGLGANVVHVGF
jgi:hypothetical protein